MGTLLHNVLIALPLAQALCWAACLRPGLHLCLHILWDHSEPLLQVLSRLGLKESNQGPRHPDQLLQETYPGRNLPSTDILMQKPRQRIPSTEDTRFVKV